LTGRLTSSTPPMFTSYLSLLPNLYF